MTEPHLPAGARRYLEQLEIAAAGLPAAHRAQLLEQIHEHLLEAIDEGVEVATVLERLGAPQELVADARPAGAARSPSWERVLLRFAIASAVACGAGLLGVALAAALSLRSMLLLPALLLLIAGAATLVTTAVLALVLRRASERDRQVRDALLSRPATVATRIGASGMLALGLLAACTGLLMMAMTGNPRSSMILAPGILLALAGALLLWRTSRATRSPRPDSGSRATG